MSESTVKKKRHCDSSYSSLQYSSLRYDTLKNTAESKMVSTRSSTRNSRSNSTSTSPPTATTTTTTKKRAQRSKATTSSTKKRKLQTPPPASSPARSPPSSPSAQLHSETEKGAERTARAREGGVLEKGVIYFFLRNKVAVERAGGLEDIKRGYVVLKPLELGESVGGEERNGKGGKVEGKCRLLAVPKKRLPTRGFEKFL